MSPLYRALNARDFDSVLAHAPAGGAIEIMEYGSCRIDGGLCVAMRFLINAATAGEQLQGHRADRQSGGGTTDT